MSERGVFALDRGVWDHPSFDDEPLTQREAWFWLIGEASYKERVRRIGTVTVELQRGQVAASLRFLAAKWQWSEPRVRRFLNRLKTDAMIDATADAGITVITICNYNKYQRVSLPSDAEPDAETDAAATQQRRNTENNKYTEENKIVQFEQSSEPKVTRNSRKDAGADPPFIEFYSAYPKHQSKQDAIKAYHQVRRSGVSHETIMQGLARAKRSDSRFREIKFTPLPASWLRAGGYEDEPNGQNQDWKMAVFS